MNSLVVLDVKHAERFEVLVYRIVTSEINYILRYIFLFFQPGAFVDVTKTYDISFYVFGGLFALSGVMCIPLRYIKKWEDKRSKRKHQECNTMEMKAWIRKTPQCLWKKWVIHKQFLVCSCWFTCTIWRTLWVLKPPCVMFSTTLCLRYKANFLIEKLGAAEKFLMWKPTLCNIG